MLPSRPSMLSSRLSAPLHAPARANAAMRSERDGVHAAQRTAPARPGTARISPDRPCSPRRALFSARPRHAALTGALCGFRRAWPGEHSPLARIFQKLRTLSFGRTQQSSLPKRLVSQIRTEFLESLARHNAIRRSILLKKAFLKSMAGLFDSFKV